MFFQDNTEEKKVSANERKMKELSEKLRKLDNDEAFFLKELDVTQEQLTSFLSNKENFTDENWDQLQQHKKKLDEKLDLELKNITNPLQTKKARASLNIAQHWLHVR